MGQELNEQDFVGVSVSRGIAYGEAYVMLENSIEAPSYEIREDQKQSEIENFENAILATKNDIEEVKREISERVGESEASIFDAHLMVLEDVAIIEETINLFRSDNKNIAYCYSQVIEKFISAFEKIDDPFIRERIADLRDVSRRLMRNLLGIKADKIAKYSEPVVLVSVDFSPSDFSLIDQAKILAIVTEKGSYTSHTAILARSLGVPCVIGVQEVNETIPLGSMVLVDGYKGHVLLNPSEKTLWHYNELEKEHKKVREIFNTSLPSPSETLDGEKFSLQLNISLPEDIPEGAHLYCDGVGLFRTENFFLNHGEFPSEDVQYEVYAKAAKALNGGKLVIRTIDLGGDKNFKLLSEIHREENPFMGYRAIRFCLDHEDIFLAQLRAILRASVLGDVCVMVPMISSIKEMEAARALVERAKDELTQKNIPFNKNIKVGAMIEVPSAAITADIIVKACDFISIGTNDLIQYLLAVDRVNERVAHLYEPTHPAVIRTLDMIVSAARKVKIPVGVCGELAADPMFASLLLGMGVTGFSMSHTSVSEIKFLLRKVSLKDARKLRDEVLQMERSRHIISKLRSFRYEAMSPYVEED